MRTIKTDIEINASAEKVWKILMNHKDYANWNPFIKIISGSTDPGEALSITVQTKGKNPMSFKPVVLANEVNKEFRWKGKLLMTGIFDGEHYFNISELDNGLVKFEHSEIFKGILVGLMPKLLDDTKAGFEQMNVALKNECEKLEK